MNLHKFNEMYIDQVAKVWNRNAFDQVNSGDHALAIVRLDSLA